MVNLGKYTVRPMDAMGNVMLFWCPSQPRPVAWFQTRFQGQGDLCLAGWVVVTVRSLVKTTTTTTTTTTRRRRRRTALWFDCWLMVENNLKKYLPTCYLYNGYISMICVVESITASITIQNPTKKKILYSEVDKSWVNPTGVHYHKSWWLGFFWDLKNLTI